MKRLLLGAAAGFAATAPMTLAMIWMHRRLPAGERYPLPPRTVTMETLETAGIVEEKRLTEAEKTGLTLVSHFGYGTAIGALYAPLAHAVPAPHVAKGAAFALAVWAGSYLGWLPAAGLISPATEHTARRNALMIAAHLVWGASVGLVVGQLDQASGAKATGKEAKAGAHD